MVRYCGKCGEAIPDNNLFCNACGTEQSDEKIESSEHSYATPDIPPSSQPIKKKGISKKWMGIGIFIGLMVLGGLNNVGDDTNEGTSQSSSQTTSTPSPTYEWVQLQSYDTGRVVLLKLNEPLDTFELPRNTQEFKVEIEWINGTKDNSLTISVFKWDSVQDEKLTQWTNIKLSSINSTPKSGTKTLTFDKQSGKYYVNIAGAASVRFTIDVYASVPS